MAWMEDPRAVGWLSGELSEDSIRESAAAVRDALQIGLDTGRLTLGAHYHTVADDGDLLGMPFLNVTESTTACEAWAENPMLEEDADDIAAIVDFGFQAPAALANQLGTNLSSINGHVPRRLSGKTAVSEALSLPGTLGAGYSECFAQVTHHPAFEAWRSDGLSATGVGDGSIIVPGLRSIGSMAPHLGAPSDGSLRAARRSLLILLLNWRYAALEGLEPRPWLLAMRTHIYQLNGYVGGEIVREEVQALGGHAFRADLMAMTRVVDQLSTSSAWLGASGEAGPVVKWVRADEVSTEGARFSYGEPDQPPLTSFDAAAYPYPLPLLAERLQNSHFICEMREDDSTVFSFSRCSSGWGWEGNDYTCASPTQKVLVLVHHNMQGGCVSVPSGSIQSAALDASVLGAPERCDDGALDVPPAGILIEADTQDWWPLDCL